MQPVSPDFLAEFIGTNQKLEYVVELLESSGFNFPEDVEIAASASSTKNIYSGSGVVDSFFQSSNLGDGQAGEPIKYAVLDQGVCRLNGNFCLGGMDAKYRLGWWTEVRSDGSGNFASPPYVEMFYTPSVEANRIRVSTTGVYPGVKKINLYVWYLGDTDWTDLGDYTFGDNDLRVTVNLATGTETKDIHKIGVSINETKLTNSYARLTEIEPIVEWSTETLGTLEDYCEEIIIRKSSGTVSAYTPAGPGFGINTCSFKMNKTAPVTPAENQLLIVSCGFNGELLQQGVFIVSEVNEGVDAWNVNAHGVLSLAAYHRYPDSIYQNIKISEITRMFLEWVGITEVLFYLSQDTTWEWYIVEGGDCSAVLRTAAETLGIAIYEREDGYICIRNSYGSSVMTINDDYIEDLSQTKPEEINYLTVHYGSISAGAPDYVLSGSGELGASETKTFVFNYSKAPSISTQPPFIESFKDAGGGGLTKPTIQEWAADAYSLTVTLHNNTATAGTFTIKMRGTPIIKAANEAIYEAKDINSIRRRGIRPHEASIYTNSYTTAKNYGDALLRYLRYCSGSLNVILNRPAPHLQLRDVVRVNSTLFGINADYVIVEIDLGQDETKLGLMPKTAVV